VALVPVIKSMGRRVAMRVTLASACLCFVLGMIDWRWTEVWNFERVTSLVAIVMISMSFGLIFLWTGEIAPTTHRGLVLSFCSVSARFGESAGYF